MDCGVGCSASTGPAASALARPALPVEPMPTYNTGMEPPSANVGTQHIVATPGTCGGRPRIEGTRIRVQDVAVWHELQGQSPEQIVAKFPHLSLAQVHAALSYYFDHREEIRRRMREDEESVARLRAAQGPGLLDQLRSRIEDHDPLSP